MKHSDTDKTSVTSLPPLRWLNSPVLFVCLLLTISALAAKSFQVWAQQRAALQAPVIAGYDWSQHANSVLITYPSKDCGCGAPPLERVKGALKKGKDVVVMAAAPSPALNALKQANFPAAHFYLVTNAKAEVIKRFSGGGVTEVSIHNGLISHENEAGQP